MQTDEEGRTNKRTTNNIMALQIDKSELYGNKKAKVHYQLKKCAETNTLTYIHIYGCVYRNIFMCACARQCTHYFTIYSSSITVICMSTQSANNTATSTAAFGAVIVIANQHFYHYLRFTLRLVTLADAALKSCAYAQLLYANKHFRVIKTC